MLVGSLASAKLRLSLAWCPSMPQNLFLSMWESNSLSFREVARGFLTRAYWRELRWDHSVQRNTVTDCLCSDLDNFYTCSGTSVYFRLCNIHGDYHVKISVYVDIQGPKLLCPNPHCTFSPHPYFQHPVPSTIPCSCCAKFTCLPPPKCVFNNFWSS